MSKAQDLIQSIKNIIFDTATPAAPGSPSDTAPVAVGYNVDGGAPVYVDISDDGIADIDANDAVYSDSALTTPYPDGTYKVTGTDFGFTVAGGIVSAVDDKDNTGPGAPIDPSQAAPAAAPPVDMSAEIGQMRSDFSAHKQAFEDYKTAAEQRFSNAENTIALQSQTLAKQDDVIKQLFSLCEQLAGTPTADPVDTPKQKFSFSNVEKKEKYSARIKDHLSNLVKTTKN